MTAPAGGAVRNGEGTRSRNGEGTGTGSRNGEGTAAGGVSPRRCRPDDVVSR
ncbi:hypothetical protein ACIBCT_27960 [Streptosporangium sp. NPDC050855]|uniref:hypothetical protein n=1 Tax=Streptosporangium sp. NPDC050855 TaxID=3366194 RepID=UPI00378C4C77